MDFKSFLDEERRRMEKYRKRLSDKIGYDVGEKAFFEWIEKYGDAFRKWVQSCPDTCIGCKGCDKFPGIGKTCIDPFNEQRHEYTEKIRKKIKESEL